MINRFRIATTWSTAKPKIFTQFRRAIGAAQMEYGLAAGTNDMNMGGAVIVGIDDDPKSADAQYGGLTSILDSSQAAWVFSGCMPRTG